MSAFDDARQLVQSSRIQMAEIQAAYAASLEDQKISPQLPIQIRNIMENLRSALDLTARGLFERYGSSASRSPRIYFPCALRGRSENQVQT